jgi:hypothetical protein
VTDPSRLRKAWKEANDLVRAAEERVGAAWAAFAAGDGGPPEKELLDEVAVLRRECDKRLAAILETYAHADKPARPRPERPGGR